SALGVGLAGITPVRISKSSASIVWSAASSPARALDCRASSRSVKTLTQRVTVGMRVCAFSSTAMLNELARTSRNANGSALRFRMGRREKSCRPNVGVAMLGGGSTHGYRRGEPLPFACQQLPRSMSVAQSAVTRGGIRPVALNQVVMASEFHVRIRSIAGPVDGSIGPGALVRILFAPPVVPGVEVRVGNCFLQFVGDDARHTVGACIAVGTCGLRFASAWTTVRIADEGILGVGPKDRTVAVPAAVLGAEAGGLVDIRRGQHEIDTFRVRWQLAATDGAGHDRL